MLTESCPAGPLRFMIHSYLWFSPVMIQYQIFSQQPDSFVLMKLNKGIIEAGPSVRRPDRANTSARNRTALLDESNVSFYSMFENLSEVNSYNSLYNLHHEWSKQDEVRFQRGRLSVVFATFPEFVTEARNIVLQQPPTVQVPDLNEDGIVVM